MKPSALFYVILTTLILITVSIFAWLGIAFNVIFYLTVLGQAFLLFSVYKVLTDDYSTEKTFDDFYEDHPIGKQDDYFK